MEEKPEEKAEPELEEIEAVALPETAAVPLEKEKRKLSRDEEFWNPRTELGKLVKAGKITSLEEIWDMGRVIKEPEIIDFFLKDLEESVLKIGRGKRPFKWVQRMTDSGRRNKYFVVVAVGNRNSFVGVGIGRAKEYGGAISAGLRQAKLSVIKIDKGCGSWDCACGGMHSIPVEVTGKYGSVRVLLKPAPKGTGLVANEVSKEILGLAGIKDVWSSTHGHTKTRANLAKSTFNALFNLSKIKK